MQSNSFLKLNYKNVVIKNIEKVSIFTLFFRFSIVIKRGIKKMYSNLFLKLKYRKCN